MLKKLTVATTMLAVALLAAGTAAAADSMEGKIVSAFGQRLTMTDDAGAQHVLTISDDAKITLDGKEAKLADLKAGFNVKAEVEKDGTALKATKIEAKSSGAGKNP